MIHNDKYSYRCSKCNYPYQSFKKYLHHFVLHGHEKMACPQCHEVFNTIEELSCHVNVHIKYNFVVVHSIHNQSTSINSVVMFQCKMCQEILVISEFFMHWEKHLMEQGKGRASVCAVNMDGKPCLKELIAHIQQPEKRTSKLKTCLMCLKKFERANELKRHIIQHLLDDAYIEMATYGHLKCQICGVGFQSGDRYKRHLRDHASLPVYKCEICDKTFSDASNFSKHKKVHNLCVLICDICGKKFQNKMFLVKHFELHETTEPIECKKCEKIFYSQSAFKRHLRKNNATFRCQICKMKFNSIKERWVHLWEVHKKRNCEADCPLCHASFRRKIDVKRHLAKEHGDQRSPTGGEGGR